MIEIHIPTQKEIALSANVITMTSREIAELTGKRHDNVMRDIRAMLVELHGEGGVLKFEDTHQNPQNGQAYPMFRLPWDETTCLLTGYDTKARMAVIKRWKELETKEKQGQSLALPAAIASQVGGIVKSVMHKELESRIPAMIQAELSKGQTSLRHGETAGQIWKRHGLPPLKNGSRKLSFLLIKHGAFTGGNAEVGGVKSKVFDPDLADKAMRDGVSALCWRYVAERQGQMLIEFNHPSVNPVPGKPISPSTGRRLRKKAASNHGKDAA